MAASSVASWLAPALVGLTVVLFARAFYVLYYLKRGNRLNVAITWLAALFVVGFWTWQWAIK